MRKNWEKILSNLYKENRYEVLEGEVMAMCNDRGDFYQFRKAMREMGIISNIRELKNGVTCYTFDWEIAKKHPVIKHIFEDIEEVKESENTEDTEEKKEGVKA